MLAGGCLIMDSESQTLHFTLVGHRLRLDLPYV